LNIYYTSQFKKDYKIVKRQNKELIKLRDVIEKLSSGYKLEPKFRDHQLTGEWKGHYDCHIGPDWILIYRLTEEELVLERTGSHSELFK